jgi:gliding motility-associated-like protein
MLTLIFSSLTINAQHDCPTSWNEWQWPTHSNWFVGKGNNVNFGDGTSAPTTTGITTSAKWDAPVYESTAAASDNAGNMVLYTNGVKLYDGAGAEIAVPGGRLLTGAETPTGDAGSASQGVFIARHPLDIENYYIFTTDDAIFGEVHGITNGFNYYVYNVVSNSVTAGPIRLQDAGGADYRSTEQVAATFHGNTIDVWISSHESTAGGTQKFFSYLLTCTGLEEVPVESSTGFVVQANPGAGGRTNERASLQFSWDGTIAGATNHNGNGTWDPAGAVTLMDFDNLTGLFSNGQKVNKNDGNWSNPYDCEFSPSGNRLYVSYQCGTPSNSEIAYIDVTTGAYTPLLNFDANKCGSLKLGGDGKIYTGTFQDCEGWSYGTTIGAISNPDGAATYNGSAVAAPNQVGWGLGNMFIAPRDWLEIQDPGVLTRCDLPVNLACLWECRGTDAENTPLYEAAWSVKPGEGSTINDTTGLFSAPTDGIYTVYFEICSIKDTLTFTVGTCGCDVELGTTPAICVGETVDLNPIVVKNSGVGVWTIDSVTTSAGVDAVLTETVTDTIFDASDIDTKAGIYKLMFRVDDTCEDSVYVEVKALPKVDIVEFGPLCDDSVLTNMSATPLNGGDVVAGWGIDGAISLTGVFDPAVEGTGWHEVIYGADSLGCQKADTIQIYVIERPDPVITQVGPYCTNDPAVNLVVVPDSGAWSGTGVNALGLFTPSNVGGGDHEIIYTISGMCGNADTIEIHVDIVHDASIATPDSTMCETDPAITLLVAELGGTWFLNDTSAGNELGGTSFDPTVQGVGVHDLIYVVNDPCGDLDTVVMTVTLNKDASIQTADSTVCANDPAVVLTTVETGGVWFVNDTTVGNELGGTSFDPVVYGDGTYDLIYVLSGSCGDIDTVVVTVISNKDATIQTPDSSVCASDPAIVLTTTETGGVWFVNDTTVGNELGGSSFDPIVYGSGTYDLIYVISNPCGDIDTIVVTVIPDKDATIQTPDSSVCANDPAVVLTTVETGGVWFVNDTTAGNELGGSSFDPAAQGAGTYELIYVLNGVCGDLDTVEVIVNPLRDGTINTPADTMSYCVLDPNPTFTVNEAGGTWDNGSVNQTGVNIEIDLDALGLVVNQRMIYTVADPCGASDTIWVTTTNTLDATITQVGPYCDSDGPVTLNVVDAGGTFSGTGIDAVTGVFTPQTAGVGIHTITYTITGNCGDIQTIDIEVIRTPDPTITNTTFDFCEDHGDELLTVAETGGIWTDITPISGGFTAGTSTFNTVDAGDGTFKIEYGFGGQCPALDTITLNITALPVITMVAQDTLCADGAAVQINTSATPSTSTTWGGAVNSTGMFDPVGNLGDNQILFDALNGVCPATDTLVVHVLPREDATIDPVPTQCVSSAPVALVPTSGNTAGTWSGTGITDADNGIFNPTIAGIGTHTITHTINGKCLDSKTTNIEVLGAPDPTITPPAVVCPGTGVIQFTAATTGGIWSGDVVNGEFDPVAGGWYEAIYTLTALCPVADTIPFWIDTIPETDFTVTARSGCIPLRVTYHDISEGNATLTHWHIGYGTQWDVDSTEGAYMDPGCFDIVMTNTYANGCVGSKTWVDAVCAYALPEADFNWNPNPADVDNSLITFNNLSSNDVVAYNWDFTDVVLPAASTPITTASPSTSNDVDPVVNFTSPNGDEINVCLGVVNQNGCINSICKVIPILDKFSVIIPNAFTPNGDGINDTFYPMGRNMSFASDYEFRVYDRWGSLIWMSDVPLKGWDGTVTELAPTSGKIAQIDVYVWRLVVNDPFTGDKHELIGHVSLVR